MPQLRLHDSPFRQQHNLTVFSRAFSGSLGAMTFAIFRLRPLISAQSSGRRSPGSALALITAQPQVASL
ncbi:hypothetical protein BBB56_12395 [Candidatus Pantoea deserta]|uniref:Uncharacterized protein n=1 Tax=Candidatus Pantoea deserta TaxID=1869313 RepID=A0A3N4NX02_9GAMM|nr:hypothetical protein BBB56_12395 [Pantoea deserta]